MPTRVEVKIVNENINYVFESTKDVSREEHRNMLILVAFCRLMDDAKFMKKVMPWIDAEIGKMVDERSPAPNSAG